MAVEDHPMQLNPLESHLVSLPVPPSFEPSYEQWVAKERIAALTGGSDNYVASPLGMAALLAEWDEEDDD
jgi:hypothetical protein